MATKKKEKAVTKQIRVKRSNMGPKVSDEAKADVAPLLYKGPGNFRVGKQTQLLDRLEAERAEGARAKRRSPDLFLQHEEEVARLKIRGVSPAEIAAALKITPVQVQEHLNNLVPFFKKAAEEDAAVLRGEQSVQLNFLWRECVEGIEESKKPEQKTTIEALRGIGGGAPVTGRSGKVTKLTRKRHADYNLIHAATSVLNRRAKLHGLDAPIEYNAIIDEREAGKRSLLSVLARHVKDPETLQRIAEELEDEGGTED